MGNYLVQNNSNVIILFIDKNRVIYVRKSGESKFKNSGASVEVGYSTEEKKKFLYNLYEMMMKRREELNK